MIDKLINCTDLYKMNCNLCFDISVSKLECGHAYCHNCEYRRTLSHQRVEHLLINNLNENKKRCPICILYKKFDFPRYAIIHNMDSNINNLGLQVNHIYLWLSIFPFPHVDENYFWFNTLNNLNGNYSFSFENNVAIISAKHPYGAKEIRKIKNETFNDHPLILEIIKFEKSI